MTLREEARATPPPPAGAAFHEETTGNDTPPDSERSLREDIKDVVEDIEEVVDDIRIYLDAELSYQKSRAGFISDRIQKTVVFGFGAAFLAFLSTIALTVGLLLALTPLITAWGATAVVVLLYLVLAYFLVSKAGDAWRAASAAMRDGKTSKTEKDAANG